MVEMVSSVAFWHALGADQLVHGVTYITLVAILLAATS